MTSDMQELALNIRNEWSLTRSYNEMERFVKALQREVLEDASITAIYWMHQEYPTQDDPVKQKIIDDSLRKEILFCRTEEAEEEQ